jgi:glycosyltransferase involved in cell wall biosynthesis
MRIAHVIDSGGLYGAERVVLALASAQQQLGHAAAIVSLGMPGEGEKAIERVAREQGLTVHTVRMMAGPSLAGIRRILRCAEAERADVVHAHGYKPDILLAMVPRALRKRPLVSTLHGYTAVGAVGRTALYRWLDRHAVSRCERVALVHRDLPGAHDLLRRAGRRCRVIENGVDPAPAPPLDASDPIAAFCADRPVVGAVGRLSPEKAFDRLVLSVASLRARGRQVRLVILGEGPERRRLEQLVREAGLDACVLLPGHRDARRYLSLFDVFVLPSSTEGLPICLMEAMQAGVPIVASAVGGVPDLLDGGRSGVLIEPGTVAAITEGVSRVLSEPHTARELAQRARRRVLDHYSSGRMAGAYIALYLDALDQYARQTDARVQLGADGHAC